MRKALIAFFAVLAAVASIYSSREHQDRVRAAHAVRQVEYAYKLTVAQKIEITSAYIQGSDVCIDFVSSDARGIRVAGRLIHLQAMHQVIRDVPFDAEFCPNGHDVTRLAEEANVR